MKIGLIRHFKVNHPFPKKFLVSGTEVIKWFEEYEFAELVYTDVDLLGVEWDRCFTSPLNRAVKTAGSIYKGEIIQVQELKELEALPFVRKRMRLPFMVWAIYVKLKSLSSSDKRMEDFKNKINSFVDKMLTENDNEVLVVSHVFVMTFLQEELMKRGFTGQKFKTPEHGRLYLFEK